MNLFSCLRGFPRRGVQVTLRLGGLLMVASTLSAAVVYGPGVVSAGPQATLIGFDERQNPIHLTIQFDRPVTGMAANDLVVTNGKVTKFDAFSADLYLATITPKVDGMVTVLIRKDAVTDLYGRRNMAIGPISGTAAVTLPTVVLSAEPGPFNRAFPVSAQFSNAVQGFQAKDIVTLRSAITGFSGEGQSYVMTVTPSADGQVKIEVPAGVCEDQAENRNLGTTMKRQVDITPPVLTLKGAVDPFSLELGKKYVEPGFRAIDAVSGNVSNRVSITGIVGQDLGEYVLTYSVADNLGNTSSQIRRIMVRDTIPPVVTCSATLPILWPADNQFVDVGLNWSIRDLGKLTFLETLVTQDEAVVGPADAQIVFDAQGKMNGLRLRAKRYDAGDGRVYRIALKATDASGNTGEGRCAVGVPLDSTQKNKNIVQNQMKAAITNPVSLPYDSFKPNGNG